MGMEQNVEFGRQADPLVTGRTEDAVRVKLSYVTVGMKVLNTLLLGTFSPSTLGRWPGTLEFGVSLGFGGWTGGRACDLGGSGAGEAEEAAGLERKKAG